MRYKHNGRGSVFFPHFYNIITVSKVDFRASAIKKRAPAAGPAVGVL